MYSKYIQRIKKAGNSSYSEIDKLSLTTHHIVPYHAGGKNVKENRLLMPLKNHVIAHGLRYLVYRQYQDKQAFRLLRADYRKMIKANISYAEVIRSRKSTLRERGIVDFLTFTNPDDNTKYLVKVAKDERHIDALNRAITEYDSDLRSRAGKKGGKANSAKQRQESTHFFDPNHTKQFLGNLSRWGIQIEEIGRVKDLKRLHPRVIDYLPVLNKTQTVKLNFTLQEYNLIVEMNFASAEEFFKYREDNNIKPPKKGDKPPRSYAVKDPLNIDELPYFF